MVVVGVTGRYALTPTDRSVIAEHAGEAEVGSVAIRPRYVGDCSAAGWLTLGAGRRTVAGTCQPAVIAGQDSGGQAGGWQVRDWQRHLSSAAANNGDAHPGTLNDAAEGCVEAIGPGAALAGARSDGRLDRYRTPVDFETDGFSTTCPLTLVDAGASSDAVIAAVATRPDSALIVTGVGPVNGSNDPNLQVIYRLSGGPPGWLTSASTRRSGIVTLTDLTQTLIVSRPGSPPAAVDGSAFAIDRDDITVPRYQRHLRSVAAISAAAPRAYAVLGLLGLPALALAVGGVIRRRFAVPRLILLAGTGLGAAMLLAGAMPWARSAAPTLFLVLAVVVAMVVLAVLARGIGRRLLVPPEVVAVALVVAAFTADAALGGVMQPGSLLNSRPIFALRWYGFGNVTFAVYAVAGLTLAGYLAHRLRQHGQPRAALVAVAAIGFGVVVCEGWPSMGSDFGGVIALTPPVLWLLLVLSGIGITWVKLLWVAAGAVLAISVISVLDWRRGPGRRSHLGDFVQRILDGDAVDVVARKAVASFDTIVSVPGVAAVLLGAAAWVLLFRHVLPVLAADFSTLPSVAWAVLGVAVLGTLLNDGGISVWAAATAVFLITVGSMWLGLAVRDGHLSWTGRAER